MICGDSEKRFSEDMHYRRLVFALIPGDFADDATEQEYISKFKKLLDYLNKLCKADGPEDNLDIKIILRKDARPDRDAQVKKTRRGTIEWMKRFIVHLRKGKQDRYEWMEIALDSTFDTRRSYRIMTNWLVASSSKVETQVQLLQRRCIQFGLKLIPVPQLSSSTSLFLHPVSLICCSTMLYIL